MDILNDLIQRIAEKWCQYYIDTHDHESIDLLRICRFIENMVLKEFFRILEILVENDYLDVMVLDYLKGNPQNQGIIDLFKNDVNMLLQKKLNLFNSGKAAGNDKAQPVFHDHFSFVNEKDQKQKLGLKR